MLECMAAAAALVATLRSAGPVASPVCQSSDLSSKADNTDGVIAGEAAIESCGALVVEQSGDLPRGYGDMIAPDTGARRARIDPRAARGVGGVKGTRAP
jgi:hypothetical protein